MKRTVLLVVVASLLVLALAGVAVAVKPHVFPSTNDLNQANGLPHVRQAEVGQGYVVLEFVNPTKSRAFFEVRLDGKKIPRGQGDPHPVVLGDVMYHGVDVWGTGTGEVVISERFDVRKKVEVRLALGGERDWDFDWVTFGVER